MSGIVYLVKKGPLYRIGSTKDFDKYTKEFKPDNVLVNISSSNFKAIEVRLLKRFKRQRIPDTNYFQLSDEQILDCKEQFSILVNKSISLDKEVEVTFTASTLITILTIFFTFLIRGKFLQDLSLGIALGSTPIWILVFSGGFGGFEQKDLPFFSVLMNRVKGLAVGIMMIFTSYGIYMFIND
tara:strand:+ start:2126 stop:2674 length:549 start_codon:yes stop_codon:yes gene_type:complete